jgi:sugar fermentation stimulation protein A
MSRMQKAPSAGEPQIFRFPQKLRKGVIIARPNRFIILVKAGGRTIRCHCPTTGRIGDLELAGLPCLYSKAANRSRKTGYTVEAVSPGPVKDAWIGINQNAANRYIEHFIRIGALPRLAEGELTREVRLGESRIDFLVGNAYVEVKTPLITLPSRSPAARVKHAKFDSFDRLIRHMGELRRSLASGGRAVIVLCYLYDAAPFKPPARSGTNSRILSAARAAEKAGVERWQVNLHMTDTGVSLTRYFRSPAYGS